MWCFVRFGTISIIKKRIKTNKTPMEKFYFKLQASGFCEVCYSNFINESEVLFLKYTFSN